MADAQVTLVRVVGDDGRAERCACRSGCLRPDWELNAFKGAKHVAILEVEAESRDCELCFPDFLPVAREVTDEQSYDSYLIARELELEVEKHGPPLPVTANGSGGPTPQRELQRNATVAAQRMANVLQTLETQARSDGETTPRPARQSVA